MDDPVMTNYCKRNDEQSEGGYPAISELNPEIAQSIMKPSSVGTQYHLLNWAWARGNAHYDWMDHFSLPPDSDF